jgi:hypothetical protein
MDTSKHIRVIIAQTVSGITLLLALLYTIGYYDTSLAVSADIRATLLALALSIVAFGLAMKIRTPLVATLLVSAGMVIWIPPISAIIADKAILIPGPILGVISFSPILGLGIAKFFTNLRAGRREQEKKITAKDLSETTVT